MDDPLVLVRDFGRTDPPRLDPGTLPDIALVLIVAGILFAIAGAIDLGLFFLPPAFGDAEWEFGTVAKSLDALPLPTLGLVLLATGLRARGGRRAWIRLMALAFGTLGIAWFGLLAVFVLDIPVALHALSRGAANPVASSGLKRVIAKGLVLGVAYPAAFSASAVYLWRSTRRQKNRVIMEE